MQYVKLDVFPAVTISNEAALQRTDCKKFESNHQFANFKIVKDQKILALILSSKSSLKVPKNNFTIILHKGAN